ncbi:hypothetical protein P692DRAFT_201688843, partial [Suillus brevipes Sb2]
VWVDSAYPLEPWCIPPFKKPHNGRLTNDQRTFNFHLSSICVHVEHTFAALKGRFQSLRDLRRNIHSENDLRTAVHWIQCCLILHNMIIRLEEARRWNEDNGTVEWAHQQGRGMVDEEFE